MREMIDGLLSLTVCQTLISFTLHSSLMRQVRLFSVSLRGRLKCRAVESLPVRGHPAGDSPQSVPSGHCTEGQWTRETRAAREAGASIQGKEMIGGLGGGAVATIGQILDIFKYNQHDLLQEDQIWGGKSRETPRPSLRFLAEPLGKLNIY